MSNQVASGLTNIQEVFVQYAVDQPSAAKVSHKLPKLIQQPPTSSLHCIADTFLNYTSPIYRSCQYEHLCYSQQDGFVLYPSKQHWRLLSTLHASIHLSSVSKPVLAAAVPNQVDVHVQSNESDAFFRKATFDPKLRKVHTDGNSSQRFYLLEDEVVWIPLYPWWSGCENVTNDVHVLWDVFLPIYSLLEVFDLQDKPYRLLMVRDDELKGSKCLESLYEYADMMGLRKQDIVSSRSLISSVAPASDSEVDDVVVCNKVSIAGMGAHADHEVYRPTDNMTDKEKGAIPPVNIGRATNLMSFRNHIHRKMGFNAGSVRNNDKPLAVFSESVPTALVQATMRRVPGLQIEIMSSQLSLRDQMQKVKGITFLFMMHYQDKTCALFVPDGATLVFVNQESRNVTSHDWEVWNNYPLLRTHLLAGGKLRLQMKAIEYIVKDELSRLQPIKSMPAKETLQIANLDNRTQVTLIQERPPVTRPHCVGELRVHDDLGYRFRSCYFDNLCFDLEEHDFVIFPSNYTAELRRFPKKQFYFSSVAQEMVASGSVPTVRTAEAEIPRLVDPNGVTSYYFLDAIWLAYRTYNSCNHGHIFWDNILPIHAMLELYSIKGNLFLSRLPFKSDCPRLYRQLEVPLLGLDPYDRPQENRYITIPHAQSRYVCARQSASGFGWFNDHGMNHHGWEISDLEWPHNLRRGPELGRVRARFLEAFGIPSGTHVAEQPVLITFAARSSKNPVRRLDFDQETTGVRNAFPQVGVKRSILFRTLLSDQMRLASQSTIFVSAAGGGTFPAFFLPKGASLILYGDDKMYLDFDLHNNHGQIRVHWLSLSSIKNDTNILVELIRDELCRLSSFPLFNSTKFGCP